MRRALLAAGALAALVAPASASAVSILGIAKDIHDNLYNKVILVLIGIGLVYFLWAVAKYIKDSGEGNGSKGVHTIAYGLLVLFVMVGVWGLLSILIQALGFTRSGDFGLR